jgi:hypothetical protein
VDVLTQERIARNDDVFRTANEKIRDAATEHGLEGPVPFICECADPGCTRVVRLDLDDYAEVRSNPRWFLTAPQHVEGEQEAAQVVARRDGFLIVEKVGRAGAVAEALADSD